MSDVAKIALVGIGGYGGLYVGALLSAAAREQRVQLVAAADPFPGACKRLADLQSSGVELYDELDALLNDHQPDLVAIASPIHLHCRHTVTALGHGAHVLCEKPLCVTLDQADRMRTARDEAERQVGIGYQWSFSTAVQRLKRDIMAGVFGAPRRLKSMVLWPRDEVYYGRNGWAGRRKAPDGELVMDSPVNNACAHFLHNMLYVLGPRTDRSARPVSVQAELYRANPIETYDTAALRCMTESGVEVLFVVSHCTERNRGPVFCYEFEHATVEFSEETGGEIIARFTDGHARSYGQPSSSSDTVKLWSFVENIRQGTPVVCGIEAATPQTQVVCAADESMPDPIDLPRSLVQVRGQPGMRKTSVAGLEEVLVHCYDQWRLPHELGVEWARAGRTVTVPNTRSGCGRRAATAHPV